MFKSPIKSPIILLHPYQLQNWNASRLALEAIGVVGAEVNPPKNPDNSQKQKPQEQNSVKKPPEINLLTQSQAQNWNASKLALMQMGVVGVGVNPSKKTDNRQTLKPVDWRLSGLVNPVTELAAIKRGISPTTSPKPVPNTVEGMRDLVYGKEWKNCL